MSFLFLFHIGKYFWDEFNNWLRVSYLKYIIQIKLCFVCFQPVFSSIFHFFGDLVWNWDAITWSVNHEFVLSSLSGSEWVCCHGWLRYFHRYITLAGFGLCRALFHWVHWKIWGCRKMSILDSLLKDLRLLRCFLRRLFLWLTASFIFLHAYIFLRFLSYQRWFVCFSLKSSCWSSLRFAQSLFDATVSIMLRIAISLGSTHALHVNIWVLWFRLSIRMGSHRNMSMSSNSWMSSTVPLSVFWGLVPLCSCITTGLLVRHSVHIFLFILALIVFTNYFGSHVWYRLFVWNGFGVRRMEVTTSCSHRCICSTSRMLGSVSSMGSVCRCGMTIPVPLCMCTTFFLVENSLEVCCQFSAFIDFWVHHSIIGMRSLVFIGILVHYLRWLMRIALILCSFQFIKSLIKLNISELLLYPSMCILSHATAISWSSSCTRAISSSVSTSKSFKHIVLANWAIVTMWWLPNWFMTFQGSRWVDRCMVIFRKISVWSLIWLILTAYLVLV